MYCIINTCSVECCWHCSDETVHYKYDKTVKFCGFRCATTSPITVFVNIVFTAKTHRLIRAYVVYVRPLVFFYTISSSGRHAQSRTLKQSSAFSVGSIIIYTVPPGLLFQKRCLVSSANGDQR